jgi:adenine C2-methylase RlmN of 23S rRNA A2503 and tRNA A37
MAANAWPGSDSDDEVGERRMRALEVFFWRSEYALSGVLRMAEVSEDSRVKLSKQVSTSKRY